MAPLTSRKQNKTASSIPSVPPIPHSSARTPGGRTAPPRDGIMYRVVAYMRVSVADDISGSHTFETQEMRIRQRLDDRYGKGQYTIEMYKDDGQSGAYGPEATAGQKKVRKGMKAALDQIASGTYDCFIVYDLSRFGRNERWFFQILDDVIVPSGVDFVSATEDLDINSLEGRFTAGMLSLVNAHYRNYQVARCKDAAATRFAQGYPVGGIGYGWRPEGSNEAIAPRGTDATNAGMTGSEMTGSEVAGSEMTGGEMAGGETMHPVGRRRGIAPVPEQGEHIIRMKDWYLSGRSTGWIAGELMKLGVTTPSGKPGVRWSAQMVRNILDNPLHAGLVQFGGELQQGRHFAYRYYEPEDYQQIRSDTARRRNWTPNTNEHRAHLLTPLATCARCGAKLRPSRVGSTYLAYRCENGLAQGQRTCREVTVKAEALEEAVVRELASLADDPSVRQVLLEEAERCAAKEQDHSLKDRARLENRRRDLDRMLQTLLEQLSKGTLSQEQFEASNATIRAERDAVQAQLAELVSVEQRKQEREALVRRVREIVLDFPHVWRHLSAEERKNVVSLLVENLSVDRRGNCRNKPDVTLRMKLLMLPEREASVYIRTGYRDKSALRGVESLTERQLVLLYHVAQGKTRNEIMGIMGVRRGTYSLFARQIRERLDVHDLTEAATMAHKRIVSLLPSLNLGKMDRSVDRREMTHGMPGLTPALMEVFPLLASGAKPKEVADITRLPYTTVTARYQRILELFGTKSIFKAGQKAREAGILG